MASTALSAQAPRIVDTLQVITNFEIGRLIVEHEQEGDERAEYGKALLKTLSTALSQEFGRGFSRRNLSNMRQFYLVYRDRPEISQTASAKLPDDTSNQAFTVPSTHLEIWQTVSAKSEVWALSWSHYLFLMGIKNLDERSLLPSIKRGAEAEAHRLGRGGGGMKMVGSGGRRDAVTAKLKGFLGDLGYA